MTPAVCRSGRAFLGLTQRELAAAAGISAQTVADFERGARTPHPNNLAALRQALERYGLKFVTRDNEIVAIDVSGADAGRGNI